MKTARIAWLSALILFALSLGWTARTAIRAPAEARIYQQRLDEIRELTEMEITRRAWQEMVAALEGVTDAPGPDIRFLLRDPFPGLRFEISLEQSQPAWPGWVVDKYQIRMPSVPREGIGSVLTLLEAHRPPWQITAIQVEASERDYDQIRLTLSIEGVRRSD